MHLRFRFNKSGKVRFTSHRDVARIWERVLRRAGLPLAYSEGFSPRPRLSFGLALSTGYESDAEYLDARLREPIDFHDLPERLSALLPVGMDVTGVVEIPSSADSLQQAVTSCRWEVDVIGVDEQIAAEAVARALAATEIVVTRERKGKQVTDDLRPGVLALDVLEPTESGCRLAAELGTQPRALRPAELLNALEPRLEALVVRRTHQWITAGDERCEPLAIAPSPATSNIEVS
ncbi:MAG: DUF2344 domain-containing protein [Acidimicrobiales bacterium]|nr:DUF2344 domain-containing protein [Acidimicrobiales bacterium]